MSTVEQSLALDTLDGTGPAEPAASAPTAPPELGEIAEIQHYELDGIPLFHLPMVGATILTISFGVGRANEPVTRGGMTHLAEHLLLTSVSDAFDHSNGSTEPFRVTFTLRGSAGDASRFLRDVCNWIERPSFARMHEEANVLRTEAAGRQGGMGLSFRMIWFRTGFQGIGTSNLPEMFLRTLDERVLREWVAEHFVAGNAAIWIAGDIPDDLLVSLPPGPRKAPVEVRWIPDLQTPTIVYDESPGVGASFFVERSTANATAFRTLDRHLKRSLRVDRGLGYDVGGEYIPVSPDHALVSVWASCLPKAAEEVERVLLEAIDDIAARGPTEEELAQHHERLVRDSLDPMAFPSRLDAHVRDVLLGRQPVPLAELVNEQWRLQPAEVATAFSRARESMLVLVPAGGKVPQRPFKPYPGPTLGSMGNGHTYELAGKKSRLPWGKAPAPRLTVAAAGVAIDDSRGTRLVAVRWEDCVAVVCEPGFRSVVARDGSVVAIDAAQWREGRGAIKLVDRLAPRDLVVPVES